MFPSLRQQRSRPVCKSQSIRVLVCALTCFVVSVSITSGQESLDDVLFDEPTTTADDRELRAFSNSAETFASPGIDSDVGYLTRKIMTVAARIRDGQVDEVTLAMQQDILESLVALSKASSADRSSNKLANTDSAAVQTDLRNDSSGGNQPGAEAGNAHDAASADSAQNAPPNVGDDQRRASATPSIEQIWGHLPPTVLSRVHNATDAEFLPEYRTRIADYYRKLSRLRSPEK